MHEHDVVVVGAGGAGLRASVAADAAGADVAVVSKLHPVRSHTGAAEGGINAALGDADDAEAHAADTMKGADYLADAPAVATLCRETPAAVVELERWGMAFDRDEAGGIATRYLAGHAAPRTTYAGAETGHHLLHTLYERVVKRGIDVFDEWHVLNLAVADAEDRTCHGVVAYETRTGRVEGFRARRGVILATGGPGQVYAHTTNGVANTGDGLAMAYRAGVPLEDMEMVQFHPTTLPSTGVLISEGVRGDGGILYNAERERFMFERGYADNAGELASRDVVSRAELREIEAGRGVEDEYVHLDMRHLGEERIRAGLENILHLAEDFEGVDPLSEPMPVKPGQHYAMGGIETDEFGRTCVDGLYAVGECACASVHGANRLGGNALPELLVFGKRAGRHAAGETTGSARVPTGDVDSLASATLDVDVGAVGTTPDRPDPTAGDDPNAVVARVVDAERARLDRLRSRDTDVDAAAVRERIQTAMSRHVGVFREASGLARALREIREARARYREVSVADPSRTFNTDLLRAVETRNLLDVAEAIAVSALARTESRGAHWRADHPTRADDEWLKHTLLVWNGGDPRLQYRPVVLAGETGTYEPVERTY